MKSLFEEMGGTYTLGADGMYYPDLALPEEGVCMCCFLYHKVTKLKANHNVSS